jgi:hypothetical protein
MPLTINHMRDEMMGAIQSDIALINEIKDVFRYRALQEGGCISKQGIKVLDELGSFLNDKGEFDHDQPKRRTMVLPYFGAIHLDLTPPNYYRNGTCDWDGPLGAETTPPSSTEQSVVGGFEAGWPEMDLSGVSGPQWNMNDPSQLSMSDGNMNWDQFIYGNELGQNWAAQVPQWPMDESAWEWA